MMWRMALTIQWGEAQVRAKYQATIAYHLLKAFRYNIVVHIIISFTKLRTKLIRIVWWFVDHRYFMYVLPKHSLTFLSNHHTSDRVMCVASSFFPCLQFSLRRRPIKVVVDGGGMWIISNDMLHKKSSFLVDFKRINNRASHIILSM